MARLALLAMHELIAANSHAEMPAETKKPLLSGPRWVMMFVMRLSISLSTGFPGFEKTMPQIPHIFLIVNHSNSGNERQKILRCRVC